MSIRRPGLLALAALAALLALAPRRAEANEVVNGMIRKFCLAAVQAELAQASKPAPSGLADFSCDCVVNQMAAGADLDDAKSTCKRQAKARFGV